MAPPQLQNLLISNRKRLALSQSDVAFLINGETGGKVCRHELFLRVPSLETALAYEVMYKRSVSELFPGLYQKIEQGIAARAKTLAEQTGGRKRNQRTAHRRQILAEIAGAQFKRSQK